jgi:hypothetical protein
MNAPTLVDYRYTYRAQLHRVRRMRARFDDNHASLTEAEDIMFSFFQNCWHLNDWLLNDKHWKPGDRQQRIAKVAALKADIKASGWLQMCRGIANATKHLEHFDNQARPNNMNANLGIGVEVPRMELIIRGPDGHLWPGHVIADRCIAEWNRILTKHGLSIAA